MIIRILSEYHLFTSSVNSRDNISSPIKSILSLENALPTLFICMFGNIIDNHQTWCTKPKYYEMLLFRKISGLN